MDRIHYAGDSIVTGTAIANALLEYAQALAQAGAAATVTIPTVNDNGPDGRSKILVGPSSQLISDTEETDHEELVDDDLVAQLHDDANRIRNYGISSPSAATTEPPQRAWTDYEY